jgi:superfamily II DNA or RNA helicase
MTEELDIIVIRTSPFEVALKLKYSSKVEIARNLSEYFSQWSPSYKYDWRYKKHVWDGKIRFYNSRKSTLPIGLIEDFKKFCKVFDYTYSIDSAIEINNFSGNTPEEIQKFIIDFVSKLNIPKKFEIRNYQYKYLTKFINKNVELLESPTASGKSLIIYMCVRYALNFLEEDQKILIIVPTIQLVRQMVGDFSDYGFDSEANCAEIYGGSKDQILKLKTNKKIIVSTWQSLYNLNPNEFLKIGMVVGDEVHEFGAEKSKSVILNCINVQYRLGTTATLRTDPCSSWTVQGMFDIPSKYIDTMTLVDKGFIAPFTVNVMNLIYDDETCSDAKGLTYIEEMDFIDLQEEKIDFIIKLVEKIVEKNENVLVLFKRIKYGNRLLEKIKEVTGIEPYYVDGSVSMSDREEVRGAMEKNNSLVAVCSFGTFSRGINIKNLSNVILTNTTKAEIKILQSIGRVLRLHENKKKAKIWDIVDNLKTKKAINYAMKHFFERKEIYDKNGFEVKFFDVTIKK